MTLRRKLLLWYSGVFFLSAAGLVSIMYLLIAHKMRREFFRYLRDEYQEAQGIVEANLGDEEELRRHAELEVLGRKYFPLSYRIYDVRRQQDVLSMAPRWPAALPARLDIKHVDERPLVTRLGVGDAPEDVVYMMTGWLGRHKHPDLILQVGMSYKRVYKRLAKMAEYLLYALVFSVVLSFLGGKFLAARSLNVVDEIATSLERIQAEDLSTRLPKPTGEDEIGRIVASANRMLSRLEESFGRVRRFAGDVAHELRTPLSALKCRLEVALSDENMTEESNKAMADALQQVNELTGLVNNLLLLARLDAADKPEELQCVKLADIIDDIAEVFEVLAQQNDLQLEIDAREQCCVRGDRTLLHRLFCNLIENAIRYTPSGGRVKVRVWPQKDSCRLSVSDTGVGIEAADVDRVFDRFYRADGSRSRETGGAGLGLSICQRIAELHGGTIQIESRKGKGTTVTVALPGS